MVVFVIDYIALGLVAMVFVRLIVRLLVPRIITKADLVSTPRCWLRYILSPVKWLVFN